VALEEITAMDAPREILRADGVSVTLAGHPILRGVSFSVAAGEFVGLIGSNGAGKTTLLRAILGLQKVSTGSVSVEGRARGRRAAGMGYLPQKVALDPDIPLRARDVVALGLDGQRLGICLPSRRKEALVDEMLAAVNAEKFADARIGRLSGGQQQRVLLAHALVSKPKLLLLDEPLANLDLRSAHDAVGLLQRLCRERGVSVVLSAHDINPLLRAMDRVVYLAEGEAVSGTTDEVVRSEVLTELYGRRVDVVRLEGRLVVLAGDVSA
jgi:zinc/manganese transport system ATP-binding protein